MSIADVLSHACLFDKIISLILSFHITDNPIECIFRELAAYHIRRTPWQDIRTQTEGQRGFTEFAELHLYQFRIVFPWSLTGNNQSHGPILNKGLDFHFVHSLVRASDKFEQRYMTIHQKL